MQRKWAYISRQSIKVRRECGMCIKAGNNSSAKWEGQEPFTYCWIFIDTWCIQGPNLGRENEIQRKFSLFFSRRRIFFVFLLTVGQMCSETIKMVIDADKQSENIIRILRESVLTSVNYRSIKTMRPLVLRSVIRGKKNTCTVCR